MFHKIWNLPVILLLALPRYADAEVFEWLDAGGRHHYSDRNHTNAKIVSVKPAEGYYEVEKVFDGDTILLGNGQKVRLLGINTPEIEGRNKSAEPGGEQAKAWLKTWLEHKKVRLEGDVEKHDKYQRRLAYVFTEDKSHVNLELVRRGFAAVNIYPPNLKYVAQLLAAQQQAEQDGVGIWRDPAYAPLAFDTLNTGNYRGWKRISGPVKGLVKTRKYSYLQFSDTVVLRIENAALTLFPSLKNYIGKFVEARGWIHKNRGRFVMTIRHPGELKVLSR